MNHLRKRLLPTVALALVVPLAALFLAACDVDSVDSTTAVLSDRSGNIYSFAGLYARVDTNGMQAPLVFPLGRQSGTPLTWLRLLQYGSRIEAYDNAGMTWAGSISTVDGGNAKFSLRGRTTAGLSVEIAGALRYNTTSQMATMDAAWIEPAFSGSIFAAATISPVVTNNPAPTNPPSTNGNNKAWLTIQPDNGFQLADVPNQWRVARHIVTFPI